MLLLALILIMIAAIIFTPIAAMVPWFVTRSTQTVAMVDEPGPVQTVSPTSSVMPAVTETPHLPLSSPTSGAVQSNQAPFCFTPADPHAFAFTPDNSSLLVRGVAVVQIFNLTDMKEAALLKAPKNIITATLSPDGKTLAWSLDDNTIQLVRISDQEVIQTLSGHTDMVGKLRFSPDGNLLVSASHDYSVRVWNLQGEELRTIQAGQVLGIGISPDGSMLATVPSDGPVMLWRLGTGEKIKDLGGFGGFDTSDAEFSRDQQYLVADLASGIFMWRISDGESMWNEVTNSMAVTFSPDGQYLAYSDIDDGNKVILASPDGTRIIRTLIGMQSPVWELYFSPDGSLIAAVDGISIHIWRAEDGALLYIGKTTCP